MLQKQEQMIQTLTLNENTKGRPAFWQNAPLLLMAERQGFEPWAREISRNGFRDRPDQPLWHLSVNYSRKIVWKNKSWDGDKVMVWDFRDGIQLQNPGISLGKT
jgi:hypothetical protein